MAPVLRQLSAKTNNCINSSSAIDGREALVAWLARELDFQGCSSDTVGAHSRYVIQIIEDDDVGMEDDMLSDRPCVSYCKTREVQTAAKRRARRRRKLGKASCLENISPVGITHDLMSMNGRMQQLLPSEALFRGLDKIKVAKAARWVQSISSDPYQVDVLIDEVRFRLQQLRNKNVAKQTGVRFSTESTTAVDAEKMGCLSSRKAIDEDLLTSEMNETSDYFCEFPALATNDTHVASPVKEASQKSDGLSAWLFGPPQIQHVKSNFVEEFEEDEGVVEDLSEPLDLDLSEPLDLELSIEDDEDDGECHSVSSEGSDLLQLVTKILHHFNAEIEGAAEDAGLAPQSDGACGMKEAAELPGAQDFAWLWDNEGNIEDLKHQCLEELDEDNFSNSTEFDFPHFSAALGMLHLPASFNVWGDAAGLGNLCTSVCFDADSEMDFSSELADIHRASLWSKSFESQDSSRCASISLSSIQKSFSCSSDTESHVSLESPKPRLRHSPPVKSRRACSFFLRGHCKKEDCEFAHDLSLVTCKFWELGECFKGTTCPFLHGYPDDAE